MTTNWGRRSKELKIGISTVKIKIVPCQNARKWEKVLHSTFKHKRIPQSEWFQIKAEEAIPRMEWLARLTKERMIVGHWKLAGAGHYYRRRKSRYNNWYTQTRSAAEHQAYINNQLEQKTSSYARQKANESRLEPGYWPTKKDPTKLEWAEKDPTYSPQWLDVSLGLFSSFLCCLFSQHQMVEPSS